MKLSEFKGEKVFDVMGELIEPITLMLADKEISTTFKDKPKLALAQYIIKAHKAEAIRILAALSDKSVDEYLADVNIISLVKDIVEMLNDEELISFFHAQEGSAAQNISTLPAGNTMELCDTLQPSSTTKSGN
jgi:transposase